MNYLISLRAGFALAGTALVSLLYAQPSSLLTPFERDSNTTATYLETIAYYEQLAGQYPQLQLQKHGDTDAGFPLHLAVLSMDGSFTPEAARLSGKQVLFINNAIHPGEPCGVDASMMLMRDILQKEERQPYLDQLVILVVPFYNISGGLNRGSYSRANQNGPQAYGFRGNARNLDLNRDFIKCDSRNAQTFNRIFAQWQPDVLVDTHSSNGADYQYTMALIASQRDKLSPPLSAYMEDNLLPALYDGMAEAGWDMTPYVYARDTPDKGIAGFLDLPRYSSGYAALHHCIGFITEAHMWKPFPDRVRSTYTFLSLLIKEMYVQRKPLQEVRKAARMQTLQQDTFAINWALDFSRVDTITFKGYEARYKRSKVTGMERLYYDRSEPYEKEIPYFKYYKPASSVVSPVAYIVPRAYSEVVERLRWNGVELKPLTEDVMLELEMYYIRDFETVESPYEGHYLHSGVEVEKKVMPWPYRKGDLVVFTHQPARPYIIATLEPQAADSYFAWNFFDGILMQKEYFSSYVFEDKAAELLEQDPELREALEKQRQEDAEFARSARAQLDFIYKRSLYYEPTHRLYPVGRLIEELSLPVE